MSFTADAFLYSCNFYLLFSPSNAMNKKIANPLTRGKRMHPYKKRKRPWPGRDKKRTRDLRMKSCRQILLRGPGFYRGLVMEDEKTFTLHGIRNKQNDR